MPYYAASLFATFPLSEDVWVSVGLVILLGGLLVVIQRPRLWARDAPSQRAMQTLLLGIVLTLSSSMANVIQYKFTALANDPYLGLLLGSMVSGVLVIFVAACTETAKSKLILAYLIGSMLVCVIVFGVLN